MYAFSLTILMATNVFISLIWILLSIDLSFVSCLFNLFLKYSIYVKKKKKKIKKQNLANQKAKQSRKKEQNQSAVVLKR